jgi:ADP-ribosyl-[dinitrogen reductase] hydrolase
MLPAESFPSALIFSHDGLRALNTPLAIRWRWDRVEGMLLGLAIGDALGNTTEGNLPSIRYARYGEIRDYVPNRHAGHRRIGLPSDDTQLAFWTVEQLLEDGHLDPEHLATGFAGRQIFGIGNTVRAFIAARKAGAPWDQAGQHSAGNGAVMRIAPVLLPHLRQPSVDLWRDAIVAGSVTHNDASSNGACVGLIGMLWELLGMQGAPEPNWWLDTYCERARLIEADAAITPRHPELARVFRGPVWRLVDTAVRHALAEELSVLDACDRWYSGALLLETMPSALYILARHGADPEEAIVRAVNDTKDNDTIAAIVGAAVGALHGVDALPGGWRNNLLGRTGADDDGRVFELIEQVRCRWGTATG